MEQDPPSTQQHTCAACACGPGLGSLAAQAGKRGSPAAGPRSPAVWLRHGLGDRRGEGGRADLIAHMLSRPLSL